MILKEKIKLFISYSHADELLINDFIKQLAPLKGNELIEEWYDRKILPGQDFQNTIDNNLSNADIICLFISPDFLSSNACIKEKDIALDLKSRKNITVLSIILKACGWKDLSDLSKLLALPKDGKPITSWPGPIDHVMNQVYEDLKRVIEKKIYLKNIQVKPEFLKFLQNTDLLTKAHSHKDNVLLDDIFVNPEFDKYNAIREFQERADIKLLINDLNEFKKIIIAGEGQSGKTTLCKKFYIDLKNLGFLPVYIIDKEKSHHVKLSERIKNSILEQYNNIELDKIEPQLIIPIIDDFHLSFRKDKLIDELMEFNQQILIVDDIFSLNIKDENLIKSYIQYKIKEFKPSLRNQLIKKWAELNKQNEFRGNDFYKNIDDKTELVNTTLGKIFNSGVMPSYPFFILSIISTFETLDKPIEQEITSQGYCYQALIFIFLKKQGVKTDEIDTYINFLQELAFYIYSNKINYLSEINLIDFRNLYTDKFNLPIEFNLIINNLIGTKILIKDNLNNYLFSYIYIYYFFVSKYLTEHHIEFKKIIEIIINNLHNNENAYITIFMTHHTKNPFIIEEIIINAMCLFEKFKPADLTKNEVVFFDEKIDKIIKATLPEHNSNPEIVRENNLKKQDLGEELNNDFSNDESKLENEMDNSSDINDIIKDFRRSIKTVEVLGSILKNRAGSLEKNKLENIFDEALKVNLRIITSFYEMIKNENDQKQITDLIEKILNDYIQERSNKDKQFKGFNENKLKSLSKNIFWNINFFVIYGLINKIIRSLGSDKLITIIDNVYNSEKTPSLFIIKHGILMWYNKNLNIDEIEKKFNDKQFSDTAKRIMKFIIVNHCSYHYINYREKQKIENKLGIPVKRILIEERKRIELE